MKFINDFLWLFWWNERYFHKSKTENYGDLLGRYLVEKISGKKVVFKHPKKQGWSKYFKPTYVTIGSILANVTPQCVVWGSGIIDKKINIAKAKFLAVRGPVTRDFLLELGYEVPAIYGDPALLLPLYYNPSVIKKYSLGIIPHHSDYHLVSQLFDINENITVIDLKTNDIEKTTNEILACEKIISSSLHGLIIAHAYQIPAVWQQFSDRLYGDGTKFEDYFSSVQLQPYQPKIDQGFYTKNQINELFKLYPSLPKLSVVAQLQQDLLTVCPFKN